MPLYEYTCPNCGTGFEKLVRRFTAEDEATCPNCGGDHARRKLSITADTGRGRGAASFSSGAACSSGGT